MTLGVTKPRKKSEFTLKIEASRDAAPAVYRCDCGHVVSGPNGEAREKMRAHRQKKHPDRPVYARTPKKPKAPKREQTAEDKAILAALQRNARKNGAKAKPAFVKPARPKVPKPPKEPNTWGHRVGKETLERLYLDELMSTDEISKLYGVSDTTVHAGLKLYGIPRRPIGGTSLVGSRRSEASWLLYSLGLTSSQIAHLAYETWGYASPDSCRTNLLRRWAEEGRPVRSKGETSHMLASEVPVVNREEALAILQGAEVQT